MATLILSVSVVVLLSALVWWWQREMGVVLRTLSTSQPRDTPVSAMNSLEINTLQIKFDAMEERVERLTRAVADGIDHVERNEKRVRGIVTGAKRRFAEAGYEDPGVEAEYDTLPEVDAPERDPKPVPAVHEDLGGETAWASVPGFTGMTEVPDE